jgi:hypothetical protein
MKQSPFRDFTSELSRPQLIAILTQAGEPYRPLLAADQTHLVGQARRSPAVREIYRQNYPKPERKP